MNFITTGKKHVTSIHQLVSRQAWLGYPKPLAALLELPMNYNSIRNWEVFNGFVNSK